MTKPKKVSKPKRDISHIQKSAERVGENVKKATVALLKYLKEQEESKNQNALLPESSPVYASIQLVRSLPRRLTKRKNSVILPHPIYTREDQEVCLITTAPEEKWKDFIRNSPAKDKMKNITKIIDMNELRKNFKAFEEKRRLATAYDYFLADEAVIPFLPKILGKTFYSRSKDPLAIKLRRGPKYIMRALNSTVYSIQDNASFSVLLGRSDFTADEISANALAVIDDIVTKLCRNDWRDVHSIVFKGVDTPSLPIYAHNFEEAEKNPPLLREFPKRIRLEVDLPDEPKNKRRKTETEEKKDSKEEEKPVEKEESDDLSDSEESGVSDLSVISGVSEESD